MLDYSSYHLQKIIRLCQRLIINTTELVQDIKLRKVSQLFNSTTSPMQTPSSEQLQNHHFSCSAQPCFIILTFESMVLIYYYYLGRLLWAFDGFLRIRYSYSFFGTLHGSPVMALRSRNWLYAALCVRNARPQAILPSFFYYFRFDLALPYLSLGLLFFVKLQQIVDGRHESDLMPCQKGLGKNQSKMNRGVEELMIDK